MSQAENNGAPPCRKVPAPIILADGTHFFPDDPDDPDRAEYSLDDGPPPRSETAFPPKKDEVKEPRSRELVALANAMTAYKRKRNLEYLLWHDVLDVLHDMGYRKVAPPAEAPAESAPAPEAANP
ncbi:MAG TPA: hypothetical protein VFW33_23580 [Gemmataceae bacterium]|nr:hypothetical protein [Gemmataceae bacterium]